MSRVFKRARAEQDLDDIRFYIAEDNIGAADGPIDTIASRCQVLADKSLSGRLRPELTPNLRSYAVKKYVVFYPPLADGIELVRVLHSARDIAGIAEGVGLDD